MIDLVYTNHPTLFRVTQEGLNIHMSHKRLVFVVPSSVLPSQVSMSGLRLHNIHIKEVMLVLLSFIVLY